MTERERFLVRAIEDALRDLREADHVERSNYSDLESARRGAANAARILDLALARLACGVGVAA